MPNPSKPAQSNLTRKRKLLEKHVSLNVAGASQAADQSRLLANNVLVASGELDQHAAALSESVDTFLTGLREAA